jgi:hypothetical protein
MLNAAPALLLNDNLNTPSIALGSQARAPGQAGPTMVLMVMRFACGMERVTGIEPA